jgi:hypothetical protein
MDDNRLAPSAFESTQRLAYSIYQERGSEDGRELEDWIAAEMKLRQLVDRPTAVETVECETEATAPKRKVGLVGPA